MVELLLLLEDQIVSLNISWLLLLPAIAAILIFQGTWLDNGTSARGRPNKYQRRLRARVLIHRALIVNLLLASFIVSRSSLTVLPNIVQGLLLTVILMLPVWVYISAVVLKTPVKKRLHATDTSKQQELSRSTSQATDSASSDHTLSVDEQMHNIDRSVGHVDIGADKFAGSSDERAPQSKLHAAKPEQNAIAQKIVESDHALRTSNQETMPATSSGELTEMVMGLQKDKIKLQKLVIAQKAVIDTERQRSQKAQVMTQDAMTVMRKAREGARVAIRVAQRERRERLRLGADNAKIRKQLENAMSAKHNKESANVRPHSSTRGAMSS